MSNPFSETEGKFKTRVKVAPKFWHHDEGSIPGVRIRVGKGSVFIPRDQLRTVCDELHDIADDYEDPEVAV